MTQQVLIILINGGLMAVALVYKDWRDSIKEAKRRAVENEKRGAEVARVKAETQDYFGKQYLDLVNELRKERKEDQKKIEANRQIIKQQALDNEECEYRHDVMELEVAHLKKKIDYKDWTKETVFVLDDNKTVILLFQHFLGKISVINCKSFLDHEKFLQQAHLEQPRIIIMDHFLDKDLTAKEVINQLGYIPAIFIMSSTKEVHINYEGTGHQFFYKGDNYVQRISKAVLEYLKSIN